MRAEKDFDEPTLARRAPESLIWYPTMPMFKIAWGFIQKFHLIKNLCKPGNSQQNLGEQGPFNGLNVLN